MIPAWVFKAAPYAAVGALCGILAWSVNGYRLNSQIGDLRTAHAQQLQVIAESAAETARAAHERQLELTRQIGELNDEHDKRVADLEAERADVAAGRRVVYVKANCPAVPADGSTAASGASDAAARLSAEAGQDYLDYKRAYAEQYSLLLKCHAYANKVMEKARN
jgi:hypothetical protein